MIAMKMARASVMGRENRTHPPMRTGTARIHITSGRLIYTLHQRHALSDLPGWDSRKLTGVGLHWRYFFYMLFFCSVAERNSFDVVFFLLES